MNRFRQQSLPLIPSSVSRQQKSLTVQCRMKSSSFFFGANRFSLIISNQGKRKCMFPLGTSTPRRTRASRRKLRRNRPIAALPVVESSGTAYLIIVRTSIAIR
ncbi:hypothetical protein AAVH_06361, partial [Aphelenchoides avenae]